MNGNEYQALAARTLSEPEPISQWETKLLWNAVGVAGEAGEIVELAKKEIFHRHGINKLKWKKELGDILWYIAGCCTALEISLEDVMIQNIEKLQARYPDGFDLERTKFREGKAS